MADRALSTRSASPLYAQMMEQIRNDIQRGVYPLGEKIPAEHELEARYDVSRVTVRRALQELTAEGLLERKQGKGTFVAMPRRDFAPRGVQGFHDSCREMGLRPGVALARVEEISAGPEDRERLGLGPEARVLEIRRVLTADGERVILEKMHFSMAYAWLESMNLKGSLYRALQEYGVQAEKSINELSLCPAGPEEAELMGIPEGTVLMKADQVVYDQKGRPLHTGERLIRGEKYRLRI